MSYVEGIDRQQSTLFPELLDDYIQEDNPVRFIDAYVDRLDMEQLGFTHSIPKETGRPPYNPADMLKLYTYGYMNKIRSSRQLEKAAQRNVELMWLLHRLVPDFKTIADFRKENVEALKKVFREFTLLCKELGLFGCELVAIDGSKFAAVNHTKRAYTKAKLQQRLKDIDENITNYMSRLDAEDQQEASVPSVSPSELRERIANLQRYKTRLEQFQQQLEQSGEKQIALTDPDSRLMYTAQYGLDVSYNVQFTVDDKCKLVADFDVTNDVNDHRQLSRMAIKAKEALRVDTLAVVADMGYYSESELRQCSDAQITCYISEPTKSNNKKWGLFTNKDFRYDVERDCYICPAVQDLTYRYTYQKKGKEIRRYQSSSCQACSIKFKCSRNRYNRYIERWIHEEIVDRVRQQTQLRLDIIKKRREIVEHPFGTIKRWMDQRYLLLRGKVKVAAEMSLTVLAYNMKRVINIVGVIELIKSLKLA